MKMSDQKYPENALNSEEPIYNQEDQNEPKDFHEQYQNGNNEIQMNNKYPIPSQDVQESLRKSIEDERIQKILRNGFIRKVYGILSIQLLISLAFVLYFQQDSTKKHLETYSTLWTMVYGIAGIGFLVIYILLACKRDLGKKVPYNYILLFILTLAEGFSCAFISAAFSFDAVILCLILTIVSSIVITIYAFMTNTDWSNKGVLLYIILCQFVVVSFFVFFLNLSLLQVFLCLVGTMIFGVYLVYDTQLIIGKFGNMYSVDDYIFATLELYMDIIRLFIEILRIVGSVIRKN